MLLYLAAASLFLKFCAAVFADEAWNVDYHYALLGEPQETTTFFHRPSPDSRASLIYTLSEQNVLGALNPKDGALVWRQVLDSAQTPSNTTFLRAADGSDLIVSGAARQVAAWSAADGRLAWSHTTPADIKDLEIFEFSESPTKDAITLVGGNSPIVERLDGETGAVKWAYQLDNVDLAYQVSVSATSVYAVLLHKTMLGYFKIRVVSLDPVTGSNTDEYTLSSENELASSDTILLVGANSAAPIIAWTDTAYTTLKVNVIGSKNIATFNIAQSNNKPITNVKLHAPYHANSLAHFLVHFQSATEDWAEVYHVNLKTSKVEKAYSLPKLSERSAFSTSTIDANVYFTRTTKSRIVTLSSVSHGILGSWTVNSFGTVSGSEDQEPIHAVAEISVKGDTVSAIRCSVWLSSGELVLLRDGLPVWQRPEALATTVAVAFATSREAENLVHELELEADSNPVQAYIHRVKRHLSALSALPELLRSLPHRFVTGFLGADSDLDSRDLFGFHKMIICATRNGRVIALDAGAAGRILWSKSFATTGTSDGWNPSLEALSNGAIRITESSDNEALTVEASTGAQTAAALSTEVPAKEARGTIQYRKSGSGLEAYSANKKSKAPLWAFVPKEGESVISIVSRPVDDPVASIGHVLGNRDVLYKYLNPNLALVVTAHDSRKTASAHVIDTVSGSVLYTSTHTGVDLSQPITSAISENWLAYSLNAESSDVSPKGHQLIVGELFESLSANDRGILDASANFSSLSSNVVPFARTQTYHIPERISKLAVTTTRQGITSRQLLAVLPDSRSIVGIPRSVIDPRRPVGRDPTKDEQAEGLVKYAPTLEFDPKWSLNHQREVIGIADVVTSPALVESTSLIFAYGLDIFGTRLSPSFSFDRLGKDFNKFQMLSTVAALAVATFIVAPLVTRKQVNTRWSFT